MIQIVLKYAENTIQSLRCGERLRQFWAWQNGSYDPIYIDPSEIIETGSRLYNKDKSTYSGTIRESFMRLHIHVDISKSRNRSVISNQQRQYFGEIKYFFKHSFLLHDEECEKILAFVELYKLNKSDSSWPYRNENGGKRRVVVEAKDTVGFAGRTKEINTREYIYWSQKYPLHSMQSLIPLKQGWRYHANLTTAKFLLIPLTLL